MRCRICLAELPDQSFEWKKNGKLNSKACKKCRSDQVKAKRKYGLLKKRVVTDGYFSWQGMISRCYKKNDICFHNYGGRGISVCPQWRHSFKQFMKDMGPRPSKLHSVDRYPDQNGNYEPGNCRWATMKEQQNNKRNNRMLSLGEVTMTMSQWAEKLGITIYALHQRLERGCMTLEEALTFEPPLIEHDGKRLSATDWAKIVAIKANTIAKRIRDGWSPKEALTKPVRNWGR